MGAGLVATLGRCDSLLVNVLIGGSLGLLLYLGDPLEFLNEGTLSRGGECGGERDPRILLGGGDRMRGGGDLDLRVGGDPLGGDRIGPLGGDLKGDRGPLRGGEWSYLLRLSTILNNP